MRHSAVFAIPGTGRGEPPVDYIHLQLAKTGDDTLGDAASLANAIQMENVRFCLATTAQGRA
jgi:hypothetical protein